MAATIRDVAKVAGVSFKTVSNVINDYPHIRESTRERVLAAIEQLEFKPSHAARSLARGRTGLIGFRFCSQDGIFKLFSVRRQSVGSACLFASLRCCP